MKRIVGIALMLAFAVFASAVPVKAQGGGATSTLRGTVGDDTGTPVPGALVTLTGPQTASAKTDAKGAFAFHVMPGSYDVTVAKGGYQTASSGAQQLPPGAELAIALTLHAASFTTLRNIGTVRATRQSEFNTSTAAVDTVTSQTFQEQGATQVTQVLNQVPGVQISLPGSSANGAVPGAITFPNVRNGLSYETASLIDGHPVSVGLYGDYVTTFLNPYLLQGVEIVKGPGAMAPEVNYAINGTVNFRTKDPTPTEQTFFTAGATNRGGDVYALGLSDTVDRLGFVVGIAGYDDPSPLHNYQVFFDPTYGNPTFYGSPSNSDNQLYGGCSLGTLPGVNPVQFISKTYNKCSLLGTINVSGDYDNLSELLKLRYRIGQSTYITASYFGGQSRANQSANTSSLVQATFAPGSGYTGPIPAGSTIDYLNSFYAGGQPEFETNNEPIFQAEVSSAIGNDTAIVRYYHATIDRIQTGGQADPATPSALQSTFYGTFGSTAFDGTPVTLPIWDYWNETELDKLWGLSFEYTHPFSEANELSFAVDANQSQSVDYDGFTSYNYNGYQCPFDPGATFCLTQSTSLPQGSQQNFSTFLLRDRAQLSPKLAATLSLYQNVYKSTYPTDCSSGYNSATNTNTLCTPSGEILSNVASAPPFMTTPVNFGTTTTTHFDPRLGLEWRPQSNVAVRLAAGSAIAPPYLNVLSQPNGEITYTPGAPYATQYANAGTLKPETAFGYDLGSDYAFRDGATFASVDFFLNNLYGQFLQSQYLAGTCTVTPCPAGGVPLYKTSYTNLSNARYEGIEASLTRAPKVGWGFVLAGSTQRGYPYNLPPNFYCSFVSTKSKPCIPANYDTNLGIIGGANYIGEYVNQSGGTTAGVDNQSVPYLQANAEINYRFKNGAFVLFGETLYGKNNSLNEPPFGLAYASLSYPLNRDLAFQVSGTNIFNTYPGLFPIFGGGVTVPLANGQSAATMGNVLGPASYRFLLTERFGSTVQTSNSQTNNGVAF